ncbi:hypothetical protein PMAYCL1PPCAC_15631, partial [Pristionchus mayeri]
SSMLLVVLICLNFALKPSESCASTSSTTTPTTTTTTTAARCTTCAQTFIMITMIGPTSQAFASDVTDTTGACTVRTLTCQGVNANIELNNGIGVIGDGDDGAVDGTATLQVTCNAAGTAWETAGV